jgi:hypothetical protein
MRWANKVDFAGPNDCWTWNGAKDIYGRGVMRMSFTDGKRVNESAHRVSWIEHFGPIPAGNAVGRTCDTEDCVNPTHLFLKRWGKPVVQHQLYEAA